MRTIKSKMTLVTVFVSSLLVLLVSLLSAGVWTHYKELKVEACRTLVDLERLRFESTAAQLIDNAAKLATLGSIYYRMADRDPRLVRLALVEYFQDNPHASSGGIWYEPWRFDPERERVCFYVIHEENRPIVGEDLESEQYDYHSLQWYVELKRQLESGDSRTAFASPHINENGTFSAIVTVGSGIFDDSGKLLGMSTLDWPLEDITHYISSIRPTPGSFVLFGTLDDDYIIALSGGDMAGNSAGQPLSTLPWFDKSLLDNDTNVIRGKKYRSFSSIHQHGIFFLVNVPEDELFETIERYSRDVTLLLFAGCVSISAVTWLMLGRFVNKPLSYLSRKAEEIGAGNLTTSIRLDTRDELGGLAKTLERMTADLREYIRRLNTTAAELSVAAEIQASMLPSVSPSFSGLSEFDIRASVFPAREVGGDFYDFFMLDDDRLAILVADVSDKGVPAALFMVVASTLIRNHARLESDLSGVFAAVNNRLCENNKAGMFVTAFMAVLNLRTGATAFVNAGHNPPCILRARRTDGLFDFLKIRPNFILGGRKNIHYTEEYLQLKAGDCLFLYTDGVTESENSDGEFFGDERLLAALSRRGERFTSISASALLEGVREELRAFSGDAPQHDDVTMLSLVYRPEQRVTLIQTQNRKE